MSSQEFLIQNNRFVKLNKKQNFPEHSFANSRAAQEIWYKWYELHDLWLAEVCPYKCRNLVNLVWSPLLFHRPVVSFFSQQIERVWPARADWLKRLQRKLFYPEAIQDNTASSEWSLVGEFILKFYWNKI